MTFFFLAYHISPARPYPRMSARPSLTRRSDGNSRSQAGARGNELAGSRGPAPRNRNEDSSADHDYDLNTSPEFRSGNDNRNAPAAGAGQQHRNRNNRERDDRSGDSGNRKRSLNEAVAEAVASHSKKIKTRYIFYGPGSLYCYIFLHSTNSDISKLSTRARGIPRFIGPFIDIQTICIDGSRLASMAATPSQ